MTLLSQEHDSLNEIDQALNRIESGRYGICEISGKPIPRPRLEAIPFARHTVECEAELEKQRKASKTSQRAPALVEANTAEEEPEEAEQEEARARGKRRRPGLPRRNGSFEADRRQSALTPSLRHSHYSKFIYGTRN